MLLLPTMGVCEHFIWMTNCQFTKFEFSVVKHVAQVKSSQSYDTQLVVLCWLSHNNCFHFNFHMMIHMACLMPCWMIYFCNHSIQIYAYKTLYQSQQLRKWHWLNRPEIFFFTQSELHTLVFCSREWAWFMRHEYLNSGYKNLLSYLKVTTHFHICVNVCI